MPHFRLTSVAQKRLCLSSLLCRSEVGEKEKESAPGATGRGTRGRRKPFPSFHRPPRAFCFSIIAVIVGIPSGSLGGRERLEK